MAASASNPLMSSQKSSQLQTVIHPLVLLAISDYITRHSLRNQRGPIVGALLGQQNGREITIEHVFDCHIRLDPDVDGGCLLDTSRFAARLDQMMLVHKERQLDLVGWYTLLPVSGPTPAVVPIHSQIVQRWNESAVLLGFHPEEALKHSVGGKLPLTIYESHYEVDEAGNNSADDDDEDRHMDDRDAAALKLMFREVPYSVETDETEMISMNYIAGGGGNASTVAAAAAAKEDRPARSFESNGKGKRRLVESDAEEAKGLPDADDVLTRDEENTLASLTAKANAIKMLHARLRLMAVYLDRTFVRGPVRYGADSMDFDSTFPSLPILRQIQALVARLDLVIPSDARAFDRETLQQANDVNLFQLLNAVTQGASRAREVGRKSGIVESNKSVGRRVPPDAMPSNSSFSLTAAGDIFI